MGIYSILLPHSAIVIVTPADKAEINTAARIAMKFRGFAAAAEIAAAAAANRAI